MQRRQVPLLLFVVIVTACTARSREPAMPQPATTVLVVNQNWLDMNVYVMRSGERIRLGTVSGGRTQRFELPRNLIFGITSLRFMVDPIGSSRTGVSYDIPVSAGDEVTLTIPPGEL